MKSSTALDWFEVLHASLMRQHFHDPDVQAARATYAAVAAHGLDDGPPVWIMLVAPPGSAKTTTLEPLEGLDDVHALDKLTPRTFLSGQIAKGKRAPSLLHRIGASGIVTFPDFSTVLSMKPDDRASILADLRRIFDGHLRKEVGTGETLDWSGRLTLAVACTPDIDRHYSVFQSLGERFVLVRWHRPGGERDGEEAALVAMNQDADLRRLLASSVALVLDTLPDDKVTVPPHLLSQIAALAEYVVRARTHVARDSTRGKNLIYLPEAEAPTRLAQQLVQLARGSARLGRRNRVNVSDVTLVRRVGSDCIPRLRWRVLENCRRKRTGAANIPKATLAYVREDLRLLGLLEHRRDDWRLSALGSRLLNRVHQKHPTSE